MDVAASLDRFEELRAAGTLFDAAERLGGNNSDVLVHLLEKLENRVHLDRLIGGLPESDAVAERTEQFLLQREPVDRTDTELLGFAIAHISEMLTAAERNTEPGEELPAGFAKLANLPVAISTEEPDKNGGAEVQAGGLFTPLSGEGTPGALITIEEIAAVLAQETDWSYSRVQIPEPWLGPSIAFGAAVRDRPGVGAWLIGPAIATEFNFEPFYRIWEAGASLWLTTSGFTVVRAGSLRWRTSSYSTRTPLEVAPATGSEWLQINSQHGPRILDLIEIARERGGTRVEFDGLEMTSLPPALLDYSDWEYISVSKAPGITGWDVIFDLPQLAGVVVARSDLTSTPTSWPSKLHGLTLNHNQLTDWPQNLHEAEQLKTLSLHHNKLVEVPEPVGLLTELKSLNLKQNQICTVSAAIGQLQQLEKLFLGGNPELADLPEEILELPAHCAVSLTQTALPESLKRARTIQQLRDAW